MNLLKAVVRIVAKLVHCETDAERKRRLEAEKRWLDAHAEETRR
jgi:hypothetical protein